MTRSFIKKIGHGAALSTLALSSSSAYASLLKAELRKEKTIKRPGDVTRMLYVIEK